MICEMVRRAGHTIDSPADLWADFDPRADPLEVEAIERTETGDLVFEKFWYTGERLGRRRVRILALIGYRRGARDLPAVLHLHGGGQTISPEWVRIWAERGYVGMSIDTCGDYADRVEHSDWGPIEQANMGSFDGYRIQPSPRDSGWYHWALVSRRALTVLEQRPEVDAKRMGIYGISMGGTDCWLVAGSDERVRTAVPIYGCGYMIDPRRGQWLDPELTAEQLRWRRVLSAEAHAPAIKCSVLYLSASNDFHGLIDYAHESLASVQAPVRCAFTPRFNHHVAYEQGRNLLLWMDTELNGGDPWPEAPAISLGMGVRGVPRATLIPGGRDGIVRVALYYAVGHKPPQARYWRSAKAVRNRAGDWVAELPTPDPWEPIHSFANVTYRSGVCLSSNLASLTPGTLGARASESRTPVIDDMTKGDETWIWVASPTDPLRDYQLLVRRDGPAGQSAVALNRDLISKLWSLSIPFQVGSNRIGDPSVEAPENARLRFWVRGIDELKVVLYDRQWTTKQETYSATVKTGGGAQWRRMTIPLESFKTNAETALTSWVGIDRLEFHGEIGDSDPTFGPVDWATARSSARGLSDKKPGKGNGSGSGAH